MSKTCRTCLLEIRDITYFMLNKKDVKSKAVRAELLACVPELQLDLVKQPVICQNCVNILQLAHSFKTRCLHSEKRIRSCIRNAKLNGKPVTLTKLFRFSSGTKGGKNCSRINSSAIEDLGVISRELTVDERCPSQRSNPDIEADNDEHERTDDYTIFTANEDSNVVANSEVSLVDGEDESDLQNIITNDGAIRGVTVQPLELQGKILRWSSAATSTDIINIMSQDLDNTLDDRIIKEEHELLTFKMEADEESSHKNENANDQERSNYYTTVNLSEVSKILNGDVKEKTESITNDPDGNNLVEGECKFAGDTAEQGRTNDYRSFTASEDFNVMNNDISTVDEKEDIELWNCVIDGGAITELTLHPLEFEVSLGSSSTPTEIMGEISRDFHNEINDDIVKEEHELIFKTETDEALSCKEGNSNNNKEERSDDWNDVKEETQSITDDADGNNKLLNLTSAKSSQTTNKKLKSIRHNRTKSLSKHVKAHSTKKSFCCKVCKYSTTFRRSFVRHMRIHTSLKPFQCNVCDYSSFYKHIIKRHMRTHTGERPFQCNVCEYSATLKQSLTKHMRTHTDEKPFQCNVCNHRMADKQSLISHMQTHTGEKPFQCNVCDYSSFYKYIIKRHVRTHTGERPFQCNVCEYSAIQKGTLNNHMRIHTGEKPFQCNVCDHRMAHKQSLISHMQTHTGEKPFQCNVCDYSTVFKHALLRHMRTHTGEKPFQCNVCDYRAGQSQHLTSHMRIHAGEKPYHCNVCDCRTVRKQNLTIHMRTHTGE